jgi:hypothetical protein
VTELAIHSVQPFAALDRRGISGRPYRVILTALRRRSRATTTAAAAWRGLRVSRRSDQYQQRTARRRAQPFAPVARSAFNVGRHTFSSQLSGFSCQLSAFSSDQAER